MSSLISQDGPVTHARVKPYVQDVRFGPEAPASASGAGEALRKETRGVALEPDSGTLLGKGMHDGVEKGRLSDRFAALRAEEHGDRHAPSSLA